jgi:cytidylate kinase
MQPIIITIDGYSSCGKSTLAKALAQQLNYIFIDSGAMYRAITLFFLRNQVNLINRQEITNAMQQINLAFQRNKVNGNNEIFLNDENVSSAIREVIINDNVSEVSTIKEVRQFAVAQQQNIGANKGLVMDGRDIGTTVFPDAELKIFMTADIETRAQRRYQELILQNPQITLEEIRANLEKRDYIDSHREVSPLRQADDAIVLDNTNLTTQQQLEIALQWAKEKA